MLYATYLSPCRDWRSPSRRVKEALHILGVGRSHEAVRQWVQRFGEAAREYLEAREAKTAVIDETTDKGRRSMALALDSGRA